MTQPVFLVGARGCGKTTTGNALARALGFRFTDTDLWLLETTDMTVAEMVERDGWPGFRRRESEALRAVTVPGTVVATGGGIVLAEENRQFMRDNGQVIYLRAPAHILASRLAAFPEEDQRPTLTGRPITDEMAEVLAARDALYRQVAHHVIDADRAPEQVVESILESLRYARAS